MKRLINLTWATLAMCWAPNLADAQLTNFSIETVIEHDGVDIPALEGYTTYRIYADLTNELDFVSAVYGDATDPSFIHSNDSIFQNEAGGNFGQAIVPALFGAFPELAFDSWLTIGADQAPAGNETQSTGFDAAFQSLNSGSGFTIADPIGGSWLNIFPCNSAPDLAACASGNEAFGGSDTRVLLAQITSAGDVWGMLNIQVFVGGDMENAQLATGFTFSSVDTDVFGCTNAEATNYDPAATIDDLSCTLPCTVALQVDNIVAPSCAGDNDGLIQVSATGFQGADYFYLDSIGSQVPQNFGNFGSLQGGLYNVYVVDAAGCTASMEVEVPDTQPLDIEIAVTSPLNCYGDQTAAISVVSATGGTGAFEYYLSSDPTNVSSDTTWVGLGAGLTYSVYAIDENECIGQSNAETLQNPTQIVVGLNGPENVAVFDASCANVADGEISVVAYGGLAPQTIEFSVDSGATFVPNTGANWTTLYVEGGTYSVLARDAYGCTATMSNPVTVGPDPITIYASSTPSSCFGESNGQINWFSEGGQGPVSYAVNDFPVSEPFLTGLPPEPYIITAVDTVGCTFQETIEVEGPTSPLELLLSGSAVSCSGQADGQLVAQAVGGSGEYSFSLDGLNFQESAAFGGLESGWQMVVVEDSFGCRDSSTAIIDEPAPLVVASYETSSGALDNTGWINVTVEGGTPPYSYAWSGPGLSTGLDTSYVGGLSSGEYVVEIVDVNGCFESLTVELVTFLGCDNIGSEGWSSLDFGLFPSGEVSREYGVPTSLEWVINVTDLIVEPGSGQLFAVQSFTPSEVLNAPPGMAAVTLPGLLGPGTQGCVLLEGVPNQEGQFEVVLRGELVISVFGTPLVIGEQEFATTVTILPNVSGIPGCMYAFASNYNAIATEDDGSCMLQGCQDPFACNYNAYATSNLAELCEYGCFGCIYPEAINYDASASLDDGTCTFDLVTFCMFDANGDGYVGSGDLLEFLGAFGDACP